MRASAMPLHFDEAMTALHWATDLQEFRFRNLADPMAELCEFAETLAEIADRAERIGSGLPVLAIDTTPVDDPLRFIREARVYLSFLVIAPQMQIAAGLMPHASETVH